MMMLEALYRPHHPWELLTGSLDASVKRWNFSLGRSLRQWQMQPADEQSSSQVRLAYLDKLSSTQHIHTTRWAYAVHSTKDLSCCLQC